MDHKLLNDLLECSVCFEMLDETSRVLPCQHTFCRRCLEEILESHHELRCPECRTLVDVKVEDLPSNILLMRLLEGLKSHNVGESQITHLPTSGIITSSSSTSTMAVLSAAQSGEAVAAACDVRSPNRHSNGNSSTALADERLPNKMPVPPCLGVSATQAGGSRIQRNSSHLSNKPNRPSQPCAKALFKYDAKEHGDLSFKTGDMIFLRKQVDENWYVGELNGLHGFLPASYVQIITPLPTSIPQAKALYDFEVSDQNEKDCLTFKKGNVIQVIRRVDENWAEGRLSNKIGIFPISFVELNNPGKAHIKLSSSRPGPAKIAPPTPSTSDTSESEGNIATPTHTTLQEPDIQRPQQNKRHSMSALQSSPAHVSSSQRHSLEIGNVSSAVTALPPRTSPAAAPSCHIQGNKIPSPVPPPASVGHPSSNQTSGTVALGTSGVSAARVAAMTKKNLPAVLYVAMFAYKPQKADELELRKGDLYSVLEKCHDGWFRGICLRTSKCGVFPGNYVQVSKSSTEQRQPRQPNTSVAGLRPTNQANTGQNSRSTSSPGSSPRLELSTPRLSQTSVATPTSYVPPSRSTQVSTSTVVNHSAASRRTFSSPSMLSQVTPTSSTVSAPPNMSVGAGASRYFDQNTDVGSSLVCKPRSSSARLQETKTETTKQKEDKLHKKTKSSKTAKDLFYFLTGGGKKKQAGSLIPLPPADGSSASVPPRGKLHCSDSDISADTAGSQESGTAMRDGATAASSQPELRPKQPTPLIRERYRCIAPYPPQGEHELELKVGDIVYVHKKRDDGWYKGTLQRTGKMGLFPGIFVETF